MASQDVVNAFNVFWAAITFGWLTLLQRKADKLADKVDLVKADHDSHKLEVEERIRLSRLEFGEEVREIVKPLHARMDRIDDNLAQVSTMVSSIINSGDHGSEPSNPVTVEGGIQKDQGIDKH